MSDFHDETFPLAFALGTSGGPQRRTGIVELASGRELRNSLWSGSRRRWDVGGGAASLDELAELTAFFEARRGRLHGFRFRDAADWKSCLPSDKIRSTDQTLGIGDGEQTSFQLVKHYGQGDTAYTRIITRPIPQSLFVAIDGRAIQDFTLDATRGLVEMAEPPDPDTHITAGFAFDVPARFDTDNLQTSLDTPQSGRALSLPIIEIIEA